MPATRAQTSASQKSPPYSITDDILGLVSRIEALAQPVQKTTGVVTPHLRRNKRIESVHSTLVIEANSLVLDQVSDVINGKTVLGPRKEIREVKNAWDAYALLDELDPYDSSQFLHTHAIMMQDLVPDAGKYRLANEGVFKDGKCIFMAPPPELVPSQMAGLFAWLNAQKEKVHPLIASSVFHYEMVFIHPFSDGNGRMARLWQTALLSSWNPLFRLIPIENEIASAQEEYYAAISNSHSAGESSPFIAFMLHCILAAVEGGVSRILMDITPEGANAARLAELMVPGVAYSSAQLLVMLDIRSRKTLRLRYLDPAISAGLVKRTIPDKPTSRNQRYIRC